LLVSLSIYTQMIMTPIDSFYPSINRNKGLKPLV
jgi:hypothetical protein